MTAIPAPDRFTGLVEAALGQSRVVRSMLHDMVLPHLKPLRRGAAEHIARSIDRSCIFHAEMLHDLDALVAFIEREAEAGTHHGWEADECHVDGGWPTVWHDVPADALLRSAAQLRRFSAAIASVLDAVEAERVANRLLTEG